MEPKYKENVSEPWFTLISLGLKTVEGRKNKGRFKEMQIGDIKLLSILIILYFFLKLFLFFN